MPSHRMIRPYDVDRLINADYLFLNYNKIGYVIKFYMLLDEYLQLNTYIPNMCIDYLCK